ncbi:murein biosynthesis integral membrane protein MurJ [Kitasatospora kifunensis]|uniref:Putative peptidoglycan lipid II flippase n=1 Tax=Kitasatospora kifunensis TaxID=58351 RepID=A0A7W7R629_KITKI|nr:murein biosynthesis integral membrane protein MurJ [Kitasatospora kifunensis]MBB4925924.1 putative peptidoglycan lipid II flippase [Kitasatospora kifunensis]
MAEAADGTGTESATRQRGRHARRRTGGAGGLARSSAVMAAGTAVSRVTGLVRLVLQGAALGSGLLASTYNTANTVPTSISVLLLGGALNSVLVPQLVRARTEHADGGRAYEQRLITLVLCVLAVGTVGAVLAAPQIIGLYMPDSPGNHAAFELTVVLGRFLLPQVFFYGLYAVVGQALNVRGKFGAMMWTPVLNNLVLITLFGLYLWLVTRPQGIADVTASQVRLLGVGTTVGIALQAVALVPYLRSAGFRWRPRFDWRGVGLRKSVNAARWTLLVVLANQVAITVVTRYANEADQRLPDAGVGNTAYSYAQTIWILPQSIVTVSLVTALLPRLSHAVAERRLDDVRADLSRALRVTGLVIVPAAFFFLAFGPQLAALLFAHGSGGAASARPMGYMLQALALGLIPCSAQSLLLRGFYAFEDTRTPFWMACWISAANIGLAVACHLLLPEAWAVTGMAAAYAVSYGIGLVATGVYLRRRLAGRLDGKRLTRTYGKLTVAAAAAGAVGWVAARACGGAGSVSGWEPVLELLAGGGVMLVLFVALARVFRVGELRLLPGLR